MNDTPDEGTEVTPLRLFHEVMEAEAPRFGRSSHSRQGLPHFPEVWDARPPSVGTNPI